jgi:hypothetical protein
MVVVLKVAQALLLLWVCYLYIYLFYGDILWQPAADPGVHVNVSDRFLVIATT